MNSKQKQLVLTVLLATAVPYLLMRTVETISITQEPIRQTEPSVQTVQTQSPEFLLPVLQTDGLVQMELDSYLTGVVLAEMPAEFETEALKAQAVVARTYALKRYHTGSKHDGRAVCTDPACCQAYCTPELFLAQGGSRELLEKVCAAVEATGGQVLTYGGELIEATYFSCSGGMTEDAKAVWGEEIPYLQAVSSPGEEQAAYYVDTVTFTGTEFAHKLGADLSGSPGSWLGAVTYTDGGGVETIQISGTVYQGTQVRKLLGLRSTAFVMTAVGERITVTTKGYGHRVGMSQYGAEAMAVQGSTYPQILSHYYPGTALESWEN